MNIYSNRWNRIRYTFYLPVYNIIKSIFRESRKKAIDKLDIQPGEKVLLIGAGTGLDIEYLNERSIITATDITPAMVGHIKKNYTYVEALVMDGQQLSFENHSFDKIILHLILAVVPDPVKCISEAERVLKPGGKISVFDKFLDDEAEPSSIRKILNIITKILFSDINRRLGDIIKDTPLKVIHAEKANFNGNFKIFILEKS